MDSEKVASLKDQLELCVELDVFATLRDTKQSEPRLALLIISLREPGHHRHVKSWFPGYPTRKY